MAHRIIQGQRVGVEGVFRLRGVPTDPAVVRCLVLDPQGRRVSLVYPDESLVREETGLYVAAMNVDTPGTWYFRWEGAGTVDAVDELSVAVMPSVVQQ